ncbi:MAG: YciI family protein [Dehalococcoidia bacterium]
MPAQSSTQFFFLKLNPPRPTFPADITDAEQAVMREHAAYWTGWTERGKVVVFGPVMDPNGVFGMAVIEAESEDEVRGLIASDPVTKAGLGSYEVHPMRVGAVRG